MELLDSPVTGMEKGAKEGTLNAYVGGDAAALEKVRPVLQSMATKITHFGAIGQGLAMKLINNMLFQVNRVLIIEGLALGAKAGLDPQQMFETISGATGNSVAFQYSAPRILNREFDGIRMDITFKDVELQTQLAKSLGMPMFMANAALQVYQMARAQGAGRQGRGGRRSSCTRNGRACRSKDASEGHDAGPPSVFSTSRPNCGCIAARTASPRLAKELKRSGCQRAVVVSGRSVAQSPAMDLLRSALGPGAGRRKPVGADRTARCRRWRKPSRVLRETGGRCGDRHRRRLGRRHGPRRRHPAGRANARRRNSARGACPTANSTARGWTRPSCRSSSSPPRPARRS